MGCAKLSCHWLSASLLTAMPSVPRKLAIVVIPPFGVNTVCCRCRSAGAPRCSVGEVRPLAGASFEDSPGLGTVLPSFPIVGCHRVVPDMRTWQRDLSTAPLLQCAAYSISQSRHSASQVGFPVCQPSSGPESGSATLNELPPALPIHSTTQPPTCFAFVITHHDPLAGVSPSFANLPLPYTAIV